LPISAVMLSQTMPYCIKTITHAIQWGSKRGRGEGQQLVLKFVWDHDKETRYQDAERGKLHLVLYMMYIGFGLCNISTLQNILWKSPHASQSIMSNNSPNFFGLSLIQVWVIYLNNFVKSLPSKVCRLLSPNHKDHWSDGILWKVSSVWASHLTLHSAFARLLISI